MIKRQISICLLAASALANAQNIHSENLPFRDANLTAEQRADDLIKRLSVKEKISLMQNVSPAIERLGIKSYDWWNEALHGVARAGLATVFPQAIGMAASFNDALMFETFNAVSDEARAKYNHFRETNGDIKRYQGLTMWTPNVNIFRDPRWGRGQETYGEDPYRAGIMGIACVNGLQGPKDAGHDKLHACAKHYAVHSGPEWNRHSFDAKNISQRDLWETYLPAFKTLVQQADVKEVMCAYNRYEGEPCCGSNTLLAQILRNEWGFKGIVVSDCGAINDFWQKNKHETHEDAIHASADAVLSGTDLECGSNYKRLEQAVERGLISENELDISVKRLLTARFEIGEMDENDSYSHLTYDIVDSQKHRDLALKSARQSIVLLQNNNNILPLKKGTKIALIGPNANDSVAQWANYNGIPSHTVTMLSAMSKHIPSDNLVYEQLSGHTDEINFTSLFDQCSTNTGRGFKSTYWNNPELKGDVAALVQQSTPFNFNSYGATAFAAGVQLRGFSAKYETTFIPEVDNNVFFRMKMRGSYEIFVNGQLLRKEEGAAIKYTTNVCSFKAEAGKKYDIVLNYVNDNKTATLCFDMGVEKSIDVDGFLARHKDIDVVVFAGGIAATLEGEEMPTNAPGFKGGDRTDIELPAVQRDIISKLKQAGKKVIFVNMSGSAMGLMPETKNCDAIIQAWYPGQAGGQAVTDVIFGDYNPAARLPITFYKSVDQISDFEDYNMKGRTYRYMTQEPLFAFGYGLSCTSLTYGKAKSDKKRITYGDSVKLSIPVKNSGKMSGDEVVQIYISRPSDNEGPSKTLRAFRRVNFRKGEKKNIEFTLNYNDFEWFDTATNRMKTQKGEYIVHYGSSSSDKDLQTLKIDVID